MLSVLSQEYKSNIFLRKSTQVSGILDAGGVLSIDIDRGRL